MSLTQQSPKKIYVGQNEVQRVMLRKNGVEKQVRPPRANTLLYLPMSSDLLDHSGNNVAITNNGVTIENGFGKFNGSSSYLYTTNDFALSSTPFTVSLWIYTTNASQTERGVITHNISTGGYYGWNIYMMNAKYRVELISSGQVNTGTISNNTWYYITLTVPSSGNTTLYVNGSSVATEGNSINWANNRKLYIGTASWSNTDINASNRKFGGLMSEVIIENKEWTSQDVLDYYNQTKANYGL